MPVEVQEQYRREWEPILTQLASAIGVPSNGVERVIVTDEENYGSAINELHSGEKFTNSNGLIGFGKTLSRLTPAGRAVSDLVVRVEGLAVLVGAAFACDRLDVLEPDLQMLSYVVPHELGHCRDSCERPQGIGSTQKLANGFKILTWAEVNSAIAFSEYAACAFSAGCVSEALLRYQFESDSDSIGQLLAQIHARRRAYRDESELYELTTKTCMEFWFVIIQAAKLFGQRLGNPALRAVPLDWSKWLPGAAADLLPNLESALAAAWEQYPDCSPDFLRECRLTWESIAEAEGFRFEEGDEGDGVFFNSYTLSDMAQGFPMPARR